MNSRERLQRIFSFKIPDRVGIQDSYWNETILRWIKEGLPEGLDLSEYFDHDFTYINFDQSLLYPEEKIREDEETITVRTSYGTLERRWKVKDGPPQIQACLTTTIINAVKGVS